MTALAHQFARLVGPFHGNFSERRPISAAKSQADVGNRRAIGAAYTKALPARQCWGFWHFGRDCAKDVKTPQADRDTPAPTLAILRNIHISYGVGWV
jgi:hypothetical protein